MESLNGLQSRVLNLDETDFRQVALEVFHRQAVENKVYGEYLGYLGVDPNKIDQLEAIPFLPIELFKTQKIVCGSWQAETVFTSSGTGKKDVSKHYVQDLSFYAEVSLRIFEHFYGSPEHYHILALLPSYLERSGSSLVHMINHLIQKSNSIYSGFYLNDHQQLIERLQTLNAQKDRKIMLWGVSFALLDLAEMGPLDLSEAVVIETGGMKGRREEMIRPALHQTLLESFGGSEIQSEYGMAELTSQAYTVNGRFQTPGWMRIFIRDINDPFDFMPPGRVGGVNVIDLSNLHSCAFIETQDLGEVDQHGRFQILGRMDNTDARGCNLLVAGSI
jgi:phenylacetate-coenzyme A ligase PaaK-like adenylate-forming protein